MMTKALLSLAFAALLLVRQVSCFRSWTFKHACSTMSWTPTDSCKVTVVAADEVDAEEYDLVVVVVNDTDITSHVHEKYQTIVQRALEQNDTKKVMHVLESPDSTTERERVAVLQLKGMGGSLAGLLKLERSVESCIVLLPENVTCLEDCTTDFLVQLYADDRYKSHVEDGLKCHKVDFVWPSSSLQQQQQVPSIQRAKFIADGVFLAKDIVNAPHNVLNSFSLAETAKRLARESGGLLTCKILEAKDCEKRGMGAYLGVARGSETAPKFIHLTYKPKGNKKGLRKVGIVGKGLLFDTGGYNIKTGGMESMKMDCGGAAAILGAARALAALEPEGVEAHFVIAACENMINERAMVPGDVLVASNGKTIEVGNTDAEGRLTMADALVYVDQELGCDSIIELSTLTGACVVSLGSAMAGMWTSDDNLANELQEASQKTGEKLWRMPLENEYKEQLKSKIADMKNIGTKYAGAITAALFLNNFVQDKTPYAHVDIAGTVWSDKIGATGWGTKLVTEWVCGRGCTEESSSAIVQYGKN